MSPKFWTIFQVSIKFGHLQFPIGILLLGLAISIISVFVEKVLKYLITKIKPDSSLKEKVQEKKLKDEIQKKLLLEFKNCIEDMAFEEQIAKLNAILEIVVKLTKNDKKLDVNKFVVRVVKEAAKSKESNDGNDYEMKTKQLANEEEISTQSYHSF